MSKLLVHARVFLALLAAALLSACATPLVTQVTNFNQWPPDAEGSTFSFIKPPARAGAVPGELEQATYEKYAQAELEKYGLKQAAAGQRARLLVELITVSQLQQRTYVQPVYEENMVFYPPRRNAAGHYFPGYWAPSRFGPTYVGDRVVPYNVQFSELTLRLLDTRSGPPGQPRPVFETRAVYEGGATLPAIAPYLVRAVMDGFPGQSGLVRKVEFDRKTGAVIKK
ncbi:DUF4136 domain-containing protein [Polaromonas sp. A23]|uniref:DUF4136 domain-containing protein n=1 Tax=Polaromonas sp. A23 TaxID=1944133 RepID=UPI000984CDD3|nr:DUF4136 domain-containing protein [Polaromonas sp. A23]